MPIFSPVMKRIVRRGALTIIDADGDKHEFGDGGGPRVTARLTDRTLHWQLAVNPELYFGEGYMDERIVFEDGTLHDFLELIGRNCQGGSDRTGSTFGNWLLAARRRLQQHNPLGIARRNVAHHYDLSGMLYDLFLDADRQYSCAYFASGNDTLEVAQDNKKRHIAAKLLLKKGHKVLDIGSGWGGLGLYLATVEGVDVTGVTLSTEQHKVATQRARRAGLARRVKFHLRDYRELDGAFDRIVSVGMFEHVGASHYREFFNQVGRLLKDDGVFLLHSIGRMEPPGTTNPWLRKYIFPGGYTPALSEVFSAIERCGLWVTDVEILRLHYAKTLSEWNRRFQANRDRVKSLYDERFCRMWEFYLEGCEAAFRWMNQMVFQVQIAKRQDAVPLTRDYIAAWEQDHATEGTLAR